VLVAPGEGLTVGEGGGDGETDGNGDAAGLAEHHRGSSFEHDLGTGFTAAAVAGREIMMTTRTRPAAAARGPRPRVRRVPLSRVERVPCMAG
jgi:hypothetical protein